MRRRHRGRWKHLKGNPQHHELSQYEERTSQCERQSFQCEDRKSQCEGRKSQCEYRDSHFEKLSVKLETFSAERFGLKKDVRCEWSKMQLIQSPKNMFGQLPCSSIIQPHKWIARVNIILLREENPPSRGEPG